MCVPSLDSLQLPAAKRHHCPEQSTTACVAFTDCALLLLLLLLVVVLVVVVVWVPVRIWLHACVQ